MVSEAKLSFCSSCSQTLDEFCFLAMVEVKKRSKLQSKSNIMLACLVETSLVLGGVSQPSNIVWRIYVIKGLSLSEYCRYHKLTNLPVLVAIFASVFYI